ncbi:unnamed protein product [Meloidogyne enterolobii]|uniref:Uncharacterized protein n=1 Tax=Meloidogyne enterolobii TaxID=390850 RepID=A0ACB1AXC5_MELEN
MTILAFSAYRPLLRPSPSMSSNATIVNSNARPKELSSKHRLMFKKQQFVV